MSKFFYKAKDLQGKIIEGSVKAFNISAASEKIEKLGLIVLEIREQTAPVENYNFSKNKASSQSVFAIHEKLEFFNSFYFMYKSGLSVLQIFQSIYSSSKNFNIRWLCSKVIKSIENGNSLETAFSNYTNALGTVYTKLLTAGEQSGKLEHILKNIIKNIQREQEIKKNIISAVTYPLILFCMAVAVFLFFKLFVLKVFAMWSEYPSQSQIMGLLAGAIIKIVLFFVIAVIAILCILKNKKLLNNIMNNFYKLFIVSKIVKNYGFANFFAISSLAYGAGIPPIQTFELANSVIDNPNINYKINKSINMIKEGCEITTAFNIAQVFSSYAMSQISSGEQSGELDKMFMLISKNYEKEVDLALKVLLKSIEPLMMVIVGIVVGYVIYVGYTSYYNNLFNMF